MSDFTLSKSDHKAVMASFPGGSRPKNFDKVTFNLKSHNKKRVLKAEKKDSAVSYLATSYEPCAAERS